MKIINIKNGLDITLAGIFVSLAGVAVYNLADPIIHKAEHTAAEQANQKLVNCLNHGSPLYYSDTAPPFKVKAEGGDSRWGSIALVISDEQPGEKTCARSTGRSRCAVNFATYNMRDGKINQNGLQWDDMSPSIDRAFLKRMLNYRIGVCIVGHGLGR